MQINAFVVVVSWPVIAAKIHSMCRQREERHPLPLLRPLSSSKSITPIKNYFMQFSFLQNNTGLIQTAKPTKQWSWKSTIVFFSNTAVYTNNLQFINSASEKTLQLISAFRSFTNSILYCLSKTFPKFNQGMPENQGTHTHLILVK